MNQRIKELAEQAGIITEIWKTDAEGHGYKVPNYEAEKFAELIVWECCDIFVELRTRPADLAVKDVKKHFGVEE